MSTGAMLQTTTNIPQRIVREIPAAFKAANVMTTQALVLLATYGRVSSDSEEQLNSYKNQEDYYTKHYGSKAGITYVGHFADEAKSGKFMRNRKDFNKLLQLCYEGKVNRIVTKSVSRFARNNVECMQIARDLKNRGVTILFETGGIDTADENAFVILGLLSVLAEEEIRTLSENIKWGFRKRNADGRATHARRMLGYLVEQGNFVIEPSEAVVVKGIFDDFLRGNSLYQIVDDLNARQINKPKVSKKKGGRTKWTIAHIENILTNEKYCGDVYTHKTWAPDIMLARRANNENVTRYEILDNHVGIISRETFQATKVEIERRRIDKLNLSDDRGKYSSKYALSGKLECGCGSKLRRHKHRRVLKSGEIILDDVWVCIAHQGKSKCQMKPIKEGIVQDAFVTALNGLVFNRSQFEQTLTNNIHAAVCANVGPTADELRQELTLAQQELITKSKNKDSYRVDEIITRIQSIQNNLELAERTGKAIQITKLKIDEATRLLAQPLNNFNDAVFRSQIQRVVILADERGKPSKLRFIFAFGEEVVKELAA
jgi:DNA invertase Pin-like site-specific DNA recombinase